MLWTQNKFYNFYMAALVSIVSRHGLRIKVHHRNQHNTVHRKILAGKKLANLANNKPFAKIFLINLHGYTENVRIWLTVVYSPNFSSPIALTCIIYQNFSPPNFSMYSKTKIALYNQLLLC